MTDKINEKVINIFARHHKKSHPVSEEEQVYNSPDGFSYVHLKHDDNGHPFDENKLLKKADTQWYIIKVLEQHKDSHTIKNFKVSGERILEFLESFITEKRTGRVIEIDKYYPDELA